MACPRAFVVPLAALGLLGCAGGLHVVGSVRTLQYVSRLEALDSAQPIYKDCRADARQPAAVFKDRALRHHRIVVRYWVVPAAPSDFSVGQEIQVEEGRCVAGRQPDAAQPAGDGFRGPGSA